MGIKADVVPPAAPERQIVIHMMESDARKLKSLMMYKVNWSVDRFGGVAERVYDALSGVGVTEEE